MIHFEEYHNAKWWTEKALRRHLADRIAPYVITAMLVAGFIVAATLEASW